MTLSTTVTAAASVVIALATIGTVATSYLQFDAISQQISLVEQQLELSKQKERAYVAAVLHFRPKTDGAGMESRVYLKNFGQTPATGGTLRGNFVVTTKQDGEAEAIGFLNSIGPTVANISLMPGQEEFVLGKTQWAKEIDSDVDPNGPSGGVRNRTYVIGKFTYKDAYANDREVNFCYQIMGTLQGGFYVGRCMNSNTST